MIDRRVDDLSSLTPNDYFLYLLAEVELLLERDRMRWSKGQIGPIRDRLARISEKIAHGEGPVPRRRRANPAGRGGA